MFKSNPDKAAATPATFTTLCPPSASGFVDFSRLARQFAARFKRIARKHGVFPSIETLDAFRYGKTNKPEY
jgi:hypothetical protein